MPYTPNPYDSAQPLDSVFAGTAAAEFRAMKIALQALSTGALYKGDWATYVATGADPHPAVLGDQFTHASALWLLKTTVADVELIPPSDADTTNWFKLYQTSTGGFVPQTSDTGAANLPSGTTAQRDVAPARGDIRENSDTLTLEYYNGTEWVSTKLVQGQRFAAAAGTEFIVSGIPAYIRELDIAFKQVSLSGTDSIIAQVGGVSGFVTAAYTSLSARLSSTATATATSTAGFVLGIVDVAATVTGTMRLRKWEGASRLITQDHSCRISGTVGGVGGGDVTMTEELTQLKITRTGTNTFDGAGEIAVFWR
jgi:hypothetical protein